MNENNRYLFVYGTLLDESNPYSVFLKENSHFYQKGRFRGALYNIGNYPGAVFVPASETFVHGSIFLIDDPKTVLKELDDYEGFGDDYAQPNEFLRVLIEVETDSASLKCWVYLYNLDTSALPTILSGRYLII